MNRRIFIAQNDQPQGPFSDEQLGIKLISGEIEPHTLACEDGAPSWRTIGELLDPQFVSKSLEFRRASQSLTPSMLQQSRASLPPLSAAPSSVPPSSVPPSSVPPTARPAGIPAISLMEPNGQQIQVPAQSFPPSVIMTSPPAAAPGGSMALVAPIPPAGSQPAAAVPAVPQDAGVKLAVEEIGAENRPGIGRKRAWLIATGIAAVLAIAGFFAWEPVEHRWRASQEIQRCQDAMAATRYQEAMHAASIASTLMPDSGIYLSALQDARRKSLEALKARLGKESPLDHLLYARTFLARNDTVLGEDALAVTKEWIADTEPLALKQVRGAFDTEIATLNALLAPHEGKLPGYFNVTENRDEAKALHDQWLILRDAWSAWDANEPLKTVDLLPKVSEDLRKKVFAGAYQRTMQLRASLLEKLRGATEHAQAQRYLETMPIFATLEPYAGWIPEIAREKNRIQLGGENFFAAKLVEAVRGKAVPAARQNLKNYMQFRRRPLADADVASFLQITKFKDYLAKLTDYGLHPDPKAVRQNYADVILVASSLTNFADAAEAHKFLGDTYLAWGKQELEKGRSSPACYLALLSAKHGQAQATPLFERAREKLLSEFTMAVRPASITVNAPKSSKSFAEQLEIDSSNAFRANLPPFVKWRGPDSAAAGEAEPAIAIRFSPVLAEMNRRNDRNVRNESKDFRFEDIIEDNPAFSRAQNDVLNAQNAVVRAQNEANQAQQQAQQLASQNYGSNFGLAMAGALLGGASQGISQAALQNAQRELVNAQSRLNNTPRQLRRENWQTVTWTETDYISNFTAQFRADVVIGDKTIAQLTCDAATGHQSMEREGAGNGKVQPVQHQEPAMDAIEAKLIEQLKPQIAVLRTSKFLSALKTGLALYVTQQTNGVDAEAQANALIGFELLWWKHPLYDASVLRSADLLGRFGDVID